MTKVPRHLTFHIIAMSCAVVFAGIHWGLSSQRISVCYDVRTPDRDVTRLYWDLGAGFDESRVMGHHTQAGRATSVCFAGPMLRYPQRIRIDPMEQPGRFELSSISVDPLDEFVPWYQVRGGLRPDLADAHHQIDDLGPQGRGTALDSDPYLIWSMPVRLLEGKALAAVNALILYCVLLAGLYLASREVRTAHGALSATPALFIYPLFGLLALLALHFVDIARYSRYVIYFTVMLYLWFVGLINKDGRLSRGMRLFGPVLAILLVISFDVAYRFGLTGQPVFTKISNDAYHWRITRTTQDNFQNASLAYGDDFAEIAKIVEPYSLFLADVATSYYVVAALPLYAANTHAHHGRRYARYRAILRGLCGENDDLPRGEVGLALQKLEALNAASGRLVLRYMFVNKDRVNKNVRGHCITRQHDVIAGLLEPMAEKIYAGQYLDVYAFENLRAHSAPPADNAGTRPP